LNYARRQQYRRLSRAGRAGAGSVVVALLALVVASAGAAPLAGLLLLIAFGLGLYARHWVALAGRSRVGARSEDDVQRALAPLREEGGGCATPCAGRVGETLTRSRSLQPGLRSRSRRKDEGLRQLPSRSSARAGGVAFASPAKMGPQRRPWHHVPRPGAGRRARRSSGLDRPLDSCALRCGRDSPQTAPSSVRSAGASRPRLRRRRRYERKPARRRSDGIVS
jgi:hypothetical protein